MSEFIGAAATKAGTDQTIFDNDSQVGESLILTVTDIDGKTGVDTVAYV